MRLGRAAEKPVGGATALRNSACQHDLLLQAPGANGAMSIVAGVWVSNPLHPYESRLYSLRYPYATEGGVVVWATTFFRLNVPRAWLDSSPVPGLRRLPVGLVVAISGANGVGVEPKELKHPDYDSADDFWLGVLASGSALDFKGFNSGTGLPEVRTFGRSEPSRPLFTVAYNNPGYGSSGVQADGNPSLRPTPGNAVGDDYCGPMAVAALECVVQAALSIIHGLTGQPGEAVRVIASSFSQGLVCLSSWEAQTKVDVHCMIDAEGPADSADQTTMAWCLADPVSDPVTRAAWATCRDRDFLPHWSHWFRPPADALPALRAGSTSGCLHGPFDQVMAGAGYSGIPSPYLRANLRYYQDWYGYPSLRASLGTPSAICASTTRSTPWDEIAQFWSERSPADTLRQRRCAYVRVNDVKDHVQPDAYQNKHAVKALLVASSGPTGSGRRGVFMADDAYLTGNLPPATNPGPSPFRASTVDPADPATWPTWPDLDFDNVCLNHIRADLVRWALGRESF